MDIAFLNKMDPDPELYFLPEFKKKILCPFLIFV